MTARPDPLKVALAIVFCLLACTARSQTYEVGPNSTVKKQPTPADNDQQLGFGSNIQNARLARAAELALQHGDRVQAMDFARRAALASPSDPQLWFLLGYAARLGGRYGESADAFSRGLKLAPSSPAGMSGLAQTYSLMGRRTEAEALLKKVLATNPGQRDDWMVLADIEIHTGNYDDALDALRNAERLGADAHSELLLAICYEHMKDMDQANRWLETAKRRAPNNPDVERSLAGYYRDTGEYSKAIDELKAIHSPQPDVVAEMAYTYQLDGRLDDSARTYEKAANSLPRDADLQLSAAQAQVAINNVPRAETFLARAEKLDSGSYRLHAIRADIAQMEDRDEDAAAEYRQAIELLPASPVQGPLYPIQLRMNLDALYQILGETSLAQEQLTLAQSQIAALNEQGPDRADFLRLRALVRMNSGQAESALADINESLALKPADPASLQLDGEVLMKMGRTDDAIAAYKKALAIDTKSRAALTALGYAERAAGDDNAAEGYFQQLVHDDPSFPVAWLALGDLYAQRREYKKAEEVYEQGYRVAPKNALIVAGGINVGVERHDMALAATWVHRVSGTMAGNPQVMAEEERYYRFENKPELSEKFGNKAIRYLPHNRDVVVYLGYDMLSLNQYHDLLALTEKYSDVFPQEPDLPLLAGYVYKHDGDNDKAVAEFSESIKRDPNVETAWVNRGYVYNNISQPDLAASDFEKALTMSPKDGEAHLGLAYADLALDHNFAAVHQSDLAEADAGDSGAIHLVRATAYGREGLLAKATTEYHAALKFTPDDASLHLGLAGVLFNERRYRDSLQEIATATKLGPVNGSIWALEARDYAGLKDRPNAERSIQTAETDAARMPPPATPTSPRASDIYLATGQAWNTLGDDQAAMTSFGKALVSPGADRVSVRMAIGQLMAQQGRKDDAERQIALAQMEAESHETSAPTGADYIQAAGVLQQLHEYELSENYLQKAQAAGASDIAVRVSQANNYLALGETVRAAEELSAVAKSDDIRSDYSYLLAEANVYQQEHQTTRAMSAFSQAASAAGEDQTAEQQLIQVGSNEGYQLAPGASVLTNAIQQPLFEDSTVYELDAKTFGNPPPLTTTTNTAELPPTRYTIDTEWTTAYHLHFGPVPTAGGFFQIRNARGLVSVPAIGVVRRDTNDYSFNFGVNPTLHIGDAILTFNSGVQATARRDSLSPRDMNQNLGRFFTYVDTSSLFHALSVSGWFIHDFGGFTELPLYESSEAGAFDFRVGSPWGKTALVTGWGMNDQHFTSSSLGNTENYYTSSYIGVTRSLPAHINIEAIAEDLRSWRVVPFVTPSSQLVVHSGTAQALRPAATVNFSPARDWSIQFNGSYENTRSFHDYDMTQNGIVVSYMRPLGRTFNEDTGEVRFKYPIRFSGGIQEQTFPSLTQGRSQEFRPYVSITLF